MALCATRMSSTVHVTEYTGTTTAQTCSFCVRMPSPCPVQLCAVTRDLPPYVDGLFCCTCPLASHRSHGGQLDRWFLAKDPTADYMKCVHGKLDRLRNHTQQQFDVQFNLAAYALAVATLAQAAPTPTFGLLASLLPRLNVGVEDGPPGRHLRWPRSPGRHLLQRLQLPFRVHRSDRLPASSQRHRQALSCLSSSSKLHLHQWPDHRRQRDRRGSRTCEQVDLARRSAGSSHA